METKIHPDLREAFAMLPRYNYEDLAQVRKNLLETSNMLNGSPCEAVTVTDVMIPGPEDGPHIRVRIYKPKMKKGLLPGVLWIHGGGYIMGAPEMDDGLCQTYVVEANCVVVSVDYRLAPENPFPAGVEDCYAALQWMANSAAELGLNISGIAVAGVSAGGGLTAAVSLMARDRGGPSIAFQMPLYPMLDNRNTTPSSYAITDGRVWNRETNIKAWEMYLGGEYGKSTSPYAAPARVGDLTGLPPTYTCIGELDVFRDETIDYVTRLLQAGVSAEFHIYPGCFHAFELDVPQAEVSQRARAEYVAALKRALWG